MRKLSLSGTGLIVGLAVVALTVAAVLAATINGGFESGDFTGWTVVNSPLNPDPGSSWFVYSGNTTPLTGNNILNPPEGTFGAVTDQLGPAAHILYQDITLAPASTDTLSFTIYYENQAAIFASPATLELTGSGIPNQQYRVDLIRLSAPVDSVSPSQVLATLFQTSPGDPFILGPTQVTADLSPYAGQTVRLRFAVVANQFFFHGAVDDVQVGAIIPGQDEEEEEEEEEEEGKKDKKD